MGLLVILSSPSGGGKSTVIQELLKHNELDFVYSISCTTRTPRAGETDGKDYFFLSEAEFKQRIKNDEFIEWEHVHQYMYGTSRTKIETWLKENKIVLLDIDVNGGIRIKEKFPNDAISIFLEPPSVEMLTKRLLNRKTDSTAEVNKRLERLPMEMEKKKYYDYIVVNNDLKQTVENTLTIIKNHI